MCAAPVEGVLWVWTSGLGARQEEATDRQGWNCRSAPIGDTVNETSAQAARTHTFVF